MEGTRADLVRAGTLARDDAPTCRLDETLADVKARLGEWSTCVVVNEQRVVLGILRQRQLEGDDSRTAEQAMSPGPSTFRPHVEAAQLARYLVEHKLPDAPITTGEGIFLGLLLTSDAARFEKHHHHDEASHD